MGWWVLRRNLIALAAAALTAIGIVLWIEQRDGRLIAGAIVFGALALLGALIVHGWIRIFRELDRGEGVVARWQVPPSVWRECADRPSPPVPSDQPHRYRRMPRPDLDAGSVEVVFTPRAMKVGDDYRIIDRDDLDFIRLTPGDPGVLEVFSRLSLRHSTFHFRMALPVPGHATAEARKVEAHFAPPRPA